MFFGRLSIKERLKYGASAIAISALSAGILVMIGVAMWHEAHAAISRDDESVKCDKDF